MVSFPRLPVGLRFKMVDLAFIPGIICYRKLSPPVSHSSSSSSLFCGAGGTPPNVLQPT
jgi:hypothetical protein